MAEEKEKTNEVQGTTLRKAALALLSENQAYNEQIIELLSNYNAKGRENDIVFALLLEMELLHRVVDQVGIRSKEQHRVLFENFKAEIAAHEKTFLEMTAMQQTLFRSQFRRLVAIHRERFLIRALVFAAILMISLFAGVGAFCFYKVIMG